MLDFRRWDTRVGRNGPSELEVSVFDRPSTFEFRATGGPIGTPDDDPHRRTFTFTSEDGVTRIVLSRRDPLPPEPRLIPDRPATNDSSATSRDTSTISSHEPRQTVFPLRMGSRDRSNT